MPLNADQLDAFWTVVQANGYHPAAERLHITQSAVTQRIQALEAAIGQRLFVRAGRGVALTEAGRLLTRHCQATRAAEAELLGALGSDGDGLAGRLAMAAGSAEGRLWLLPSLAELASEHPGLTVDVRLDDTMDGVSLLERCAVDAVLGEVPIVRRGLRSRRLGATRYVLVASPALSHDWPSEPQAETLLQSRAIDFATADRVTLDHLALCLPGADLGALRRHFVNDTQGILALVLGGAGYSVLPAKLVAPAVAAGGLTVFHPAQMSERALYLTRAEGFATRALSLLEERLAARMAGNDKSR